MLADSEERPVSLSPQQEVASSSCSLGQYPFRAGFLGRWPQGKPKVTQGTHLNLLPL